MKVKQCRDCKRPISIARKAENTAKWVVLDAVPHRPHSHPDAHRVRVLDGAAYSIGHMTEHLDMRFSYETDRGPIEDFPWHTIHTCPKKDA